MLINLEDSNINNNKELKEDNNKNKNHLGDKLNKHFSPLLFIGVFGGFVIYIAFSLFFIKKAQKNKSIKEALTNLNLQQTEQIIFEIEDILIYRTQTCFDLLRKIEANAVFFSSLYDNNKIQSQKVEEYINKNTINLNNIGENIEKDYNKGIWGKNEDAANNDEITDDIKKELFIFTSLNPLLYSVYKSINFKEQYVENIFIITNKKHLFYDYPLVNDSYFKEGKNRAFCFNEIKGESEQLDEIIMPNIYDYHCQEWFADSINLQKMTNYNAYISSPYYIEKKEKLLIITLCINSTKFSNNIDDNIEIGDYYLFCLNFRYQVLIESLEIFNHKLSGYFFITRVHTQKAFYYPKRNVKSKLNISKIYYFDNFDTEEFNLNDNYYLDELNKYLNKTSSFIESYNTKQVNSLLDSQDQNLRGEFLKDNNTYLYNILPTFNHLSNKSINLMNIIYICPDEVIEKRLQLITDQTVNISSLSFPFFLFLIQTVIVQILVSYLIYAIAFNIVLPMKNIKKVFEKFNNDSQEGDDETENLLLKNIKISMNNNNISSNMINVNENNENLEKKENKNEPNMRLNRGRSFNMHQGKKIFKRSINEVVNINKKNNTGINFFDENKDDDYFLNNYKESDSDSDNEESYINIKSKDIQDLFCKMINVKNSLDIVNSDEQNDIRKLSDILFASQIFKEIKNESAKNICLSNIGNILLKLKKYDIAILHLIESYKYINDEDKK